MLNLFYYDWYLNVDLVLEMYYLNIVNYKNNDCRVY